VMNVGVSCTIQKQNITVQTWLSPRKTKAQKVRMQKSGCENNIDCILYAKGIIKRVVCDLKGTHSAGR
jgi:hypothetical protein